MKPISAVLLHIYIDFPRHEPLHKKLSLIQFSDSHDQERYAVKTAITSCNRFAELVFKFKLICKNRFVLNVENGTNFNRSTAKLSSKILLSLSRSSFG